MKRFLIILFLTMFLTGCSKIEKKYTDDSRFMAVESTAHWMIVVDKETSVMYAVSYGGYNCGNFTLLVDADGKPLIWDGEQE